MLHISASNGVKGYAEEILAFFGSWKQEVTLLEASARSCPDKNGPDKNWQIRISRGLASKGIFPGPVVVCSGNKAGRTDEQHGPLPG